MSAPLQTLPNGGSHAWLHRFERSQGLRIGHSGGPVPLSPAHAFPVRIEERLGFASEPRAFWQPPSGSQPARLVWGCLGVFSPTGLLPEHDTERLLHAAGGPALAQWVSGLTQRLFHLYYRSWAMLRPECESGRPDDRFSALLQVLAGAAAPSIAHLAWHRPALQHLPLLARELQGLKLQVSQAATQRHLCPDSFALGSGRLGQAMLGRHFQLFGAGAVRIRVLTDTLTQFRALRQPASDPRRLLDQLVATCMPAGISSTLHIVAPRERRRARLGDGRVGHSHLSHGEARP